MQRLKPWQKQKKIEKENKKKWVFWHHTLSLAVIVKRCDGNIDPEDKLH